MRPWIVSFVVVALCVGAVLWLWRDDPARDSARLAAGGADTPASTAPQGPLLTEPDVRAYLDVYPRIQDALGRMGRTMQEATARGKVLDTERLGAEMRADVANWLKPHHLTLQDWDDVRRRVEFVVDCERWERDRPDRERELRDTIDRKRAALAGASTDAERNVLQAEIERFEAQFGVQAPAVAEEDLRLVRSFWAELDRVAVRSPTQRSPGSSSTPDRE